MNKKGVKVQDIVITLVLLMFAAFILLGFFVRIPLASFIDDEACRDSVILRASFLGTIGENVPGAILPPLKCKTKQLEIKNLNEEAIKKSIADEMYVCWNSLGRGRLDFLRKSTVDFSAEEFAITQVKSACVICTVISFDEKIKKTSKNINLLGYLANNNPPLNNITYLEFFSEQKGAQLPSTDTGIPLLSTDKEYAVVFFEFDSVGMKEVLKRDGVLLLGGLFIGGSAGPKAVGALVKNPHTLAALAAVSLAAIGYQTYTAYNGQLLAATYCSGELGGCSQVMLIDYNRESINSLCQTMQSVP